jgi:hypothetical protein
MDSITAVEFAQDLASWLKRPVEPTIIWSYSTIGILAQHLAEQCSSEHAAATHQSPDDFYDFPNQTADLSKQFAKNKASGTPSSEEEIANLLAMELTQVKESIKHAKHNLKQAIRRSRIKQR